MLTSVTAVKKRPADRVLSASGSMTKRPATLLVHPGTPPGPDPLSDVLRTVRVTGALFFLTELSSPCEPARVPDGDALARGLAPKAQNIISYHVVTHGSVWTSLYKGRAAPVRLDAGDIVVVPRGDAYWLGMDAKAPRAPDIAQTIGFLNLIASARCSRRSPKGWRTERSARSALLDRFAKLVGQPPMAYLTQWRMQLAAQILADGAKVSAAALEVGYDSEAAFSRAFKRTAGMAPGAWRERRKTGAP